MTPRYCNHCGKKFTGRWRERRAQETMHLMSDECENSEKLVCRLHGKRYAIRLMMPTADNDAWYDSECPWCSSVRNLLFMLMATELMYAWTYVTQGSGILGFLGNMTIFVLEICLIGNRKLSAIQRCLVGNKQPERPKPLNLQWRPRLTRAQRRRLRRLICQHHTGSSR